MKLNREILQAAKMSHLKIDRLTGEAALLSGLRLQPNLLVQMDEFSRFLHQSNDAKSSPGDYNLLGMMLTLFGHYGPFTKTYAEAKKSFTLDFAHLSILGACVPSDFFAAITEASFKTGLVPRLLFFEGESRPTKPDWFECKEPPEHIVDWCIGWPMVPRTLETADRAKQLIREYSDFADEQGLVNPPITDAVWSRVAQIACRLAILYTVSENRDAWQIEPAAMRWGIELTKHLANRLLRLASENMIDGKFDAMQRRFVDQIKRVGFITASSLMKKFHRVHPDLRSSVLKNIVETRQVGLLKMEPKNRTIKVYFDHRKWNGEDLNKRLDGMSTSEIDELN